MRQVLQDLKTGDTKVVDVPAPRARPGHLLIATRRSLISAGTERMLVEFGQASLLGKARSQPEKVRQVLDKILTDGLLPTLEVVFSRLGQPLPLGYCNAGIVLEVGEGVRGFNVGDRVVSNGPHAEIVCVPKNLCARIPDGVSNEEAAFTVLASVALQGVRLAAPTLGENVVVIGLGLLGLLTTQILSANGCRVLGFDLDAKRVEMARQFGGQAIDLSRGADPVKAGLAFSRGKGVDAVLITASTKSSDPVHQAAQMSRKRGRIVLVGVTGLKLLRSDFYEKELTFQVSCSYGPGRYDESYEQKGWDYPFGFVRWTEQRNFEAVLGLMADGRLHVRPMISRRVPQAQAAEAYRVLTQEPSTLGVVLTYPDTGVDVNRTILINSGSERQNPEPGIRYPVVGMIGAGNFATLVLAPALCKTKAQLRTIASTGGTSAAEAARKFGFQQATSDERTILADPEINVVFIVTRHDTHSRLVVEALKAGKHVFVEKPLSLCPKELAAVLEAVRTTGRSVTVGFNRRFSPHTMRVRGLLSGRGEPLAMTMTINAGMIPANHWVHDPEIGGGRIVGEACHFIDLMVYLSGAKVRTVSAMAMGKGTAETDDTMVVHLEFEDGSIGTVNYFANGSRRYPKETLEVFSQGRIARIENFRTTRGYGFRGFRRFKTGRQDKGHRAEMAAFVRWLQEGGEPVVPLDEAANATLAAFAAVRSANERRVVDLAEEFGGLLSERAEI